MDILPIGPPKWQGYLFGFRGPMGRIPDMQIKVENLNKAGI